MHLDIVCTDDTYNDVTRNGITNNDVTDDNISEYDVTDDNISDYDVTNDDVTDNNISEYDDTENDEITYAVPESKYQYHIIPNGKPYKIPDPMDGFTPLPPKTKTEEQNLENLETELTADFVNWWRIIKRQNISNVEKSKCVWKNWSRNQFEDWYAKAITYKMNLEPEETFIENINNTQSKKLFDQMDQSENRKKCWKSLKF